jgi:heat shock protein HtpX
MIWLTTFGVFLLLSIVFGVILLLVGADNMLLFAIPFSFLMIGIQWYIGPTIVKMVSGAHEVSEAEAPELHQIVGELAAEAGIPKPKVCIVQNNTPNAFAFGRTQKSSYIAVHTGLLKMLSRQEVRAVLAHEIGHIRNRDVAVITAASVLPVILYWGAIIFLGGSDRNRKNNPLGMWIGALLAQFVGQLAVLWLSRQREYFADAYSKEAIGDPLPLARSLVKISYSLAESGAQSNPSMKAFYIGEAERISPELLDAVSGGRKETLEEAIKKEEQRGFLEIFSTHPRTSKRLKALLT